MARWTTTIVFDDGTRIWRTYDRAPDKGTVQRLIREAHTKEDIRSVDVVREQDA